MEELDTKTLLAMSRTCSTFRSLLHSDQGAAAWKCARANTGRIPDLLAKDLEEWMLASLLFDTTCHVRRPFLSPRHGDETDVNPRSRFLSPRQICHKNRAQTVDYVLRARGCANCMRNNSVRRDKMKNGGLLHRKVWECVPESKCKSRAGKRVPPQSVTHVIACVPGSPGYGEVYLFYWTSTLYAVSDRLFALDGKPGFDTYVEERRKVKAAATVDGVTLAQWESRYAMKRQDDKADATASRKQK